MGRQSVRACIGFLVVPSAAAKAVSHVCESFIYLLIVLKPQPALHRMCAAGHMRYPRTPLMTTKHASLHWILGCATGRSQGCFACVRILYLPVDCVKTTSSGVSHVCTRLTCAILACQDLPSS